MKMEEEAEGAGKANESELIFKNADFFLETLL